MSSDLEDDVRSDMLSLWSKVFGSLCPQIWNMMWDWSCYHYGVRYLGLCVLRFGT